MQYAFFWYCIVLFGNQQSKIFQCKGIFWRLIDDPIRAESQFVQPDWISASQLDIIQRAAIYILPSWVRRIEFDKHVPLRSPAARADGQLPSQALVDRYRALEEGVQKSVKGKADSLSLLY